MRAVAVTGAAVLLALAGCAAEPVAPRDLATVAPTVVVDKEPAAPLPDLPDVWPLTGLAGDVVERPAVSVKVENTAQARPQTGLEDADVVWEELVEGGITRFNAVFHSRLPEVVGPIRSVRPMDAGIAAPLGGVLVISGGQPRFLSEVRAAGLQLIDDDGDDGGFFRSAERPIPHNLYGWPEDFLEQADAAHGEPPPGQFRMAPRPELASVVEHGTPASVVDLSFPATNPGWTWDETTQTWLRDERGVPSMAAGGERLAADNVVVVRVEVVDSGALDPAGHPVPETVMLGEGEALVAGAGRTMAATWSKAAVDEPLVLTDAQGEPVELVPGTTWVELLPVRDASMVVVP